LVIVLAVVAVLATGQFCVHAQESSSSQDAQPTAAQSPQQSGSPELTKAENAILASDWKTADSVLDAWIAGHPDDARALFDAGYSADAQGRSEDALKLYNRAVTANPRSFEAQVSLGLLLARVGRDAEARPALDGAVGNARRRIRGRRQFGTGVDRSP
jgi:Flp pilus assembly protein TadD